MSSTEADYQAAADWAENEMTLKPGGSAKALRGEEAAAYGRDLVARALGGRPPLNAGAAPGQRAKVRTVRLSDDLEAGLLAIAADQSRRPSDVLRDAVSDYIAQHQAS
jgi:hypothetical protein